MTIFFIWVDMIANINDTTIEISLGITNLKCCTHPHHIDAYIREGHIHKCMHKWDCVQECTWRLGKGTCLQFDVWLEGPVSTITSESCWPNLEHQLGWNNKEIGYENHSHARVYWSCFMLFSTNPMMAVGSIIMVRELPPHPIGSAWLLQALEQDHWGPLKY